MNRKPPAVHSAFPPGFVWGAAAASYQIEGAVHADGRGPSVWDMLCRRPGAIWNGQNGDVACDHYHRWPEDVGLMRELGLKGYRFSVAWPRILPTGTGRVNPKGIAFYDRLVDALLKAGIQPWVTLFHWDYPQDLYDRGGWLSPDSPKWFADYTKVVVRALSDRVRHWMTQNEPQCYIGLGHRDGIHAPGDKLGWREVLLAAHHSMLAHGLAVRTIRAHARRTPLVGAAPVGSHSIPASDRPADIAAARRATFAVASRTYWNTSWWTDPLVFGRYPEDGLKVFGADVPKHSRRDLEIMKAPLDFFGANIYQSDTVRAGKGGKAEPVTRPVGHALTAYKWPVTPDALYWGPKFFWERYRLPIVVTENGMSSADWVALDGQVHDPQRIDYLARYLGALKRAIRDGVPVLGYFQWSIMDNFEWAEGYKERFGLIHVDYPTGTRTPKDSWHWYRDVIASHGAAL
jgi:beta-glucosidase